MNDLPVAQCPNCGRLIVDIAGLKWVICACGYREPCC